MCLKTKVSNSEEIEPEEEIIFVGKIERIEEIALNFFLKRNIQNI
jgi:hypothetical protein